MRKGVVRPGQERGMAAASSFSATARAVLQAPLPAGGASGGGTGGTGAATYGTGGNGGTGGYNTDGLQGAAAPGGALGGNGGVDANSCAAGTRNPPRDPAQLASRMAADMRYAIDASRIRRELGWSPAQRHCT